MGVILRFLLIFFVFYFLIRTVTAFFGLSGKKKANQKRTRGQNQKKNSKLDDVGDYIDYEEVNDN